MKRMLLVLPFLLGNMPAPCPAIGPGDRVVDVTVSSIEHATYRCAVGSYPAEQRRHCISTWPGEVACDVVLHLADGTTRSVHTPAQNGTDWCDLPAGHHTAQLCAPTGPVECALDLGDDYLYAYVESSLPRHARVHLRLADGTDLVRDTDDDFVVGERLRYVLRAHQSLLEWCDIVPTPVSSSPRPTGHGCGHCGAGPSQPPSFVLVGAMLLILRRRRR